MKLWLTRFGKIGQPWGLFVPLAMLWQTGTILAIIAYSFNYFSVYHNYELCFNKALPSNSSHPSPRIGILSISKLLGRLMWWIQTQYIQIAIFVRRDIRNEYKVFPPKIRQNHQTSAMSFEEKNGIDKAPEIFRDLLGFQKNFQVWFGFHWLDSAYLSIFETFCK